MSKTVRRPKFAVLLLSGAITGVPGAAVGQAPVQASLDLQAGLGYSTNPLLESGEGQGSGFGRLSASGLVAWNTERSMTSLSGYLENSTYFSRYSSKQIFNLAAHTEQSVSERLRIFGDLGFSGDFGGNLSSRFFAVPNSPVIPDPTIPESFVGDSDLFGIAGRQYRVSGQVGAAMTLSARDSVNVSVGAQHVFTGNNSNLNYNQFDATVGYERQLDERLTIGGRAVVQHSGYKSGGFVTSIGPQATVRAQLSQKWDATAAVGFLHTRQDAGGVSDTDSSVDLALDGSLCRNLEAERLCGRVSRRSQSTVIGGSTSTSAGIDYYRRLNQRDTIQLNASAARDDGLRAPFEDLRSTFFTASASYNRMLNERLSAGAEATARSLSRVGPDPKADVGASLFVRYRLGSI